MKWCKWIVTRLLAATAAATAGGLAAAPTAKEYFDVALPGLMGYGEMMVRGLGGIGWGLAESMLDFESTTESMYDNVVNRMQQLTSGMEYTPQTEAVGSQIRENAETVLPRGVVEAYLEGVEPAAAWSEENLPDWLGPKVGATLRLGELLLL